MSSSHIGLLVCLRASCAHCFPALVCPNNDVHVYLTSPDVQLPDCSRAQHGSVIIHRKKPSTVDCILYISGGRGPPSSLQRGEGPEPETSMRKKAALNKQNQESNLKYGFDVDRRFPLTTPTLHSTVYAVTKPSSCCFSAYRPSRQHERPADLCRVGREERLGSGLLS